MRSEIKLSVLLLVMMILQLLISKFVAKIYPSLPELLLWYLLLFYPDKWYFIGVDILMLETFSLPPVPGFYILLFLLVGGGLYIGKDLFATESPLFIVFYLLLIEIAKWVLLEYIYLVLQAPLPGSFGYHLFYLLIQIVTGIFLFRWFDRFLGRMIPVELVV